LLLLLIVGLLLLLILFNFEYHRLPPIVILPLLKLAQRVHLRLCRYVLVRLVLSQTTPILGQLIQCALILVHHGLTRLNQRPCRFVRVDGLHTGVGDLAVRGLVGRGVVDLRGGALRVGFIGLQGVCRFEADFTRLGMEILQLEQHHTLLALGLSP
jgi:hypothetical protein